MKTRKQSVTMNENPCLWFNQTACKDWLASTSGKHRATLRMLEKLKSPCLHFPGTKSLIILVVDIVWCSCCLMVGHSIHKSFKIIGILEVKRSFGMGFARGIPWLKHRSNTWIYSSWECSWLFSAKPPQMIYVREVSLGLRTFLATNHPSATATGRPHSSTWTRGTKEPILSDSAHQQRTPQNPFDISNWG